MAILDQIENYIQSQAEAKQKDLQALHDFICEMAPKSKLWFLDGKDENGKVVSNPNIGYGLLDLKYADGSSRPFYQVGISANSTGISVYIMGLKDKNYLKDTYGPTLGKATITGYCIKFKKLADIHLSVLTEAIRYGLMAR